jgi:hypothetical protein
MQTTPDVSVLGGSSVTIETFGAAEICELLQFHPLVRVDMMPAPL